MPEVIDYRQRKSIAGPKGQTVSYCDQCGFQEVMPKSRAFVNVSLMTVCAQCSGDMSNDKNAFEDKALYQS